MSEIILKFDLPKRSNKLMFTVPKGAKALHVGTQRGGSGYDEPKLWLAADADAFEQHEHCWFEVVAVYTGALTPPGLPYLGTAILAGGATVLHYFGRVVPG
jgi:hypothetical protein